MTLLERMYKELEELNNELYDAQQASFHKKMAHIRACIRRLKAEIKEAENEEVS